MENEKERKREMGREIQGRLNRVPREGEQQAVDIDFLEKCRGLREGQERASKRGGCERRVHPHSSADHRDAK